ncbi:class I adenylate cyclase [Shewanella sp. AS1]|uniref:class I adenylate cyclase n=1 Tax=Shewanella sp. AS1 TaxID=2907626 RepID=UPI001F36670C|nr:class I adenylate cyclase [Shewanella sp. AS1]MCE9680457.1 class I adenylate cyclase [Shewanella sp. AS1]
MSDQAHFIKTAERLNQVRLARALAILTPLQRNLFHLIPFFFHYHQSGNPGYNSPMTPRGVVNYGLDDAVIQACQTLEVDMPVVLKERAAAIHGIYTMGSTATFGQNPRSDIDVWVIFDPHLTKSELVLLQQKSDILTDWFIEHQLEVNIYLVHPKQFLGLEETDNLASTIGCENSGSAQHWLLLEEFYRSHICIAGKPVAWWPDAATPDTHLFLGDVRNLPASEYFGASLWQLYKGLDKPHKALLKVMLLEAYASDYPNTELVTRQVWQRTLSADFSTSNDAYFILYQSIENYLIRKGDMRRLEIVRRCFYLKCGIRLTENSHPKDWRYFKLKSLVQEWGWSDNLLSALDKCDNWHCGQLQWFNEQLNELMLGSYQTLLHFASENRLSDKLKISELGLLTRKLHTYFSDDDKQIISLNKLWSRSVEESNLTVIYSHNTQEYYLYRCLPESKNFRGNRAVYHSSNKAKLLIWATLNGVSTTRTQWHDFGGNNEQTKQLTKAARRLPEMMKASNWRVSKLDLCQPWHFKKLIFLINFNSDPTVHWHGQEVMVDYINGNIFSLGRKKLNMLQSLDVICQNSWGEWHSHHFDGNEAILNALVYVTPGIQRAQGQVQLDVVSCTSRLSKQSERAIAHLVSRLNSLCIKGLSSSTMVHPLEVGGIKYGLFLNTNGLIYQDLTDSEPFYKKLSKRQLLELPRPDLGNDPFSKIPKVIQQYAAIGAIQYFLRQREQEIDVFVLDEHNNVKHYIQPGHNLEELVSQVGHHYAFADSYIDNERFNMPQFFKLIRVDGKLKAKPFGVNVDEAAIEF